ncbi:MAG: P1 family peptidase [Rhodoferax sp.]
MMQVPSMADADLSLQPGAWYPGAITDVPGIEVGHSTDTRRPTGCTVVLARAGAVAGVDVRGAAPGTRETDLLQPANWVQQVHAVCLAGGSAWGLDAASGVMRWLEQQGIGLDTGYGRVPIVPAAVVFDLSVGDACVRPDAAAGFQACELASTSPPAQGNFGAGAGALVGKLFGLSQAMRGGVGTAALRVQGVTVGALIVCNAVGDVVDPHTARVLAGARMPDGVGLIDTHAALLRGALPASLLAGRNTTIGVIATDAVLDKAQCQRLALAGHDGLARSIGPVHTAFDGDTLFALSTGKSDRTMHPVVLATLAAEATARAVVNAVACARSLSLNGSYWPAANDLR